MPITRAHIANVINTYFKDKPVAEVYLVGSYARSEQTGSSDIDIIIQPKRALGLFTLSRYRLDLEDLLGNEVDLTTIDGVSEFVKPNIDKDKVLLYEGNLIE